MMRWLLLLAAFPAFGYTVGGSITGLDSYLVLRLNSQYTYIAPPYATYYQFSNSLTNGTNYAVTIGIQPSGMKCTVKNWLANSTTDVTNANITCVKTTTVTVTWTRPTLNTDGTPLTDLTSYLLYYGTDPTLKTYATRLIPASTLTTTVTNLTPGNTYYFSIASVSASGGVGPRSNFASITK